MKQILTLALLASTVGACKTTQKVQKNKNQEITKEIKQPTKKVETNKNEEIKKEFRQPKQKIEVWESNKKYFFGDYAQYESLNIKLMNTWYSAFQDLKTASGNDLNAKQDALLSVVKKVAKGKDKEFGDREVVIPKARELVKSLEVADAKLKAAILKAKEPFNKLKPYKYKDNNKIIKEIKKKAIIRLNQIEIDRLIKKRKDIVAKEQRLLAAVDRKVSAKNTKEIIDANIKKINDDINKELATKYTYEKGTIADDKLLSKEAAGFVNEKYGVKLNYEIFLGKGKKLDELKNAFVEEQTQKESKALQDAKEVIYESVPKKRK